MDNLNDSADIFANSSTETVAENIDYSLFIKQNNFDFDSYNNYNEINYQLITKPSNNEIIKKRINRPFFTSSPLNESSSIFISNLSNTSANVSFITKQFVSEACNIAITLYCPFCPDEFKLEFLLKEHIKVTHPNELKTVIRRDPDDECVQFNPCPFCHASFYIKELLPKHIVRKHQESILSMFSDINPDRYVHCPFCKHKVLVRHSKLLVNHIEKKHSDEFNLAINMKCSNILLNSYDLSYYDYRAPPKRNNSICSSLTKKMNGLTTNSGSDIKTQNIKSILKKTTSYPDGLNMDESIDQINEKELSTFSLNNSSFIERRSVRRRLRFELPFSESPPSDDDNKENSIFNPNKKRNFTTGKEKTKSKWRNLFRINKKKKDETIQKNKISQSPNKSKLSPKIIGKNNNKEVKTTPVYSSVGFKGEGVSQLAIMQFKCGLCFEGFSKNALLLEHLRRNHKGLKLIPQYRCGECDAKFFRNSFLVRHCWFHHTPKCLKTNTNEA